MVVAELDTDCADVRVRENASKGYSPARYASEAAAVQVPAVLAFISQIVTLEPGDLIFTGTPPGVGISRNPQVLLKAGDVAEVEIQGIGVLKNPVVAE